MAEEPPVAGADAVPSDIAIEAYGDSLTAAFLSGTDVTHPPPLKVVSKIISDLAMYLVAGDKKHIAQHHRPELAWPVVLGQLLAPQFKADVKNSAVSGAHVYDLSSQVGRVGAPGVPTFAFFFIGHNDMCNSGLTPDELAGVFRDEYQRALSAWDAKHEGSVAYLMPVGDIRRVFEVLKGYVWFDNGQGKYQCEDSWEKFFPYCPSFSKKLKAGTLSEYLDPRMTAVNRTIAEMATQLSATSKKNRFLYVDKISHVPYEPRYFAVDCYHLSAAGQQEVAQEVKKTLFRTVW